MEKHFRRGHSFCIFNDSHGAAATNSSKIERILKNEENSKKTPVIRKII